LSERCASTSQRTAIPAADTEMPGQDDPKSGKSCFNKVQPRYGILKRVTRDFPPIRRMAMVLFVARICSHKMNQEMLSVADMDS
jgi:hypothetical protein